MNRKDEYFPLCWDIFSDVSRWVFIAVIVAHGLLGQSCNFWLSSCIYPGNRIGGNHTFKYAMIHNIDLSCRLFITLFPERLQKLESASSPRLERLCLNRCGVIVLSTKEKGIPGKCNGSRLFC